MLTSAQAAYWLEKHEATIRRACIAEKYPGATKGVNGWVIPLIALPVTVQQRYMEAQHPVQVAAPPAILPALADKPLLDADALYLAYRRAPHKSKERADKLAAAVADFEDLRAAGASKGNAAEQIKSVYQVDNVTLWRARLQIEAQPRELWPSLLLPSYKGRTKEAELTPDAWDWIKSHYLNTSETPVCVVIKEAKKVGRALGWGFPSNKTITRKINALPAPIFLLGRKGKEAFDATFPAAERDFTSYGLHDTWVSDGRTFDVFCLWPDGTRDRPFIVAWCDMRSRVVLGVRGGINPSARLTLSALHSAMFNFNIKPLRALIDNGREYAAKSVTGGQKTRYRFHIKEDDPIGALTRMGIVADWSRPYRGQEKPIESFWKYIANQFDKLPMFQGAYCGKDTASKPSDFDAKKNAIPIAILSAKLAEILESFNREHKHRGHGMNGKPPQQVYDELMQAEPYRIWPRPSAEDLRLLCLEQRMLTLNNKDASIRFKLEGYGEVRYGNEALIDLPMSARAKKYNVYNNSDVPDLPILVYDGERFICEAQLINKVGNKEAAAQHCINKAAFKKPRAAEFKALKKAAPVCLPAPAAPVFAVPVVIEKPAALVAIPAPAPLVEISPGVFTDTATGETFGTPKPKKPTDTQAAEESEKYRRIAEQREAERIAKRFRAA
jgi:transposase InsO family protein